MMIRRIALLILLLSGSLPSHSQEADELYSNYRQALTLLTRTIAAHGGLAALHTPTEIRTNGYYYDLGHYAVPNETHKLPLQETFTAYQPTKYWLLQTQLIIDNVPQRQITWATTDTVFQQEYFVNEGRVLPRAAAAASRQEMLTVWPGTLLLQAYECRASLRLLDSTRTRRRLLFTTPSGISLLLQIGTANTLDRVQWLEYNSTSGDNTVTVDYQDYRNQQGVLMPTRRLEKRLGLLEKEITYQSQQRPTTVSDTLRRALSLPKAWATPLAVVSPWQVLPVASRLRILQAMSSDAKVLVAEFADHLALFDVPTGIELNQQLIDTLAQLYPRKPIQQIFVSHHHPAHAGGLKAYSGLPVSIITTPGNLAYLKTQATSSHSLGPADVVSTNPRMLGVSLNQKTVFADKRNAVEVWEMGRDATHHTAEYCLYYFPAQRVLFVGDLISFRANGTVAGGARGRALYEFVARQKLPVERIYTAWPAQQQRPFGTLEELKAWATKKTK